MTRPWQVWLSFAISAAVAVAATGWLTVQSIRADLQRSSAQAMAELEQRINLALWRMDTKLAPLIAEEVARPHRFYRSPVSQGAESNQAAGQQALVSPLPDLTSSVLLNFTCSADGQWTSPQVPEGPFELSAPNSGPAEQTLDLRRNRLTELADKVSVADLLGQLSDQELLVLDRSSQALPPGNYYAANDLQQGVQSLPGKPGKDFQERGKRYQDVAQQEFRKQRFPTQDGYSPGAGLQTRSITESVSQPIWVGENLLLARKIVQDDQTMVQGSWLNWPLIRESLLTEASDLLPHASLDPVVHQEYADPTRMLAGLPVVIDPHEKLVVLSLSSPMRWALGVGWGALLVALAAVAGLLAGVVALSERRAAFVSSVTHELRSPLTTFRMYSEMLAKDMVPDAARRREYLETLRREADRLTHLVENVLSYARLERRRWPRQIEQLSTQQLVDRLQARLAERASQAGMELVVSVGDDVGCLPLSTDVGAVEQILFNLVDNAAKYAAAATDRRIELQVEQAASSVRLIIRDRGPGFGSGRPALQTRPFSKTAEQAAVSAPGVGLGLALCRRLAKQLSGRLEISTSVTEGAEVTLVLPVDGP